MKRSYRAQSLGTVAGEDDYDKVLEHTLNFLATFDSSILVGLLLFVLTAIVISLWVPGFVVPLAASSGALLNSWWGAAPVLLGSLLGSMVIFLSVRRLGTERAPQCVKRFLARHNTSGSLKVCALVVVLRLGGAPHFLISAGFALTHMRAGQFAVATALGMMPAVLIAAIIGSSLT